MKTPSSFSQIAYIISQRKKEFSKLVVVLSAMGQTTDELHALSKQVHPNPPKRELDMLLTVGERISISLLAMALDRIGLRALSYTGSQSGIITDSNHNQAIILEIKPHRIESCLKKGNIAIVAGFQGVSQGKEITTLGRGGSDTSAVALAVALKAHHVEFYKDVGGVYSQDPKSNPQAQHLPFLTYDQALRYCHKDEGVIHTQAIEMAEKNSLPIKVLSFNNLREYSWIAHSMEHTGTL